MTDRDHHPWGLSGARSRSSQGQKVSASSDRPSVRGNWNRRARSQSRSGLGRGEVDEGDYHSKGSRQSGVQSEHQNASARSRRAPEKYETEDRDMFRQRDASYGRRGPHSSRGRSFSHFQEQSSHHDGLTQHQKSSRRHGNETVIPYYMNDTRNGINNDKGKGQPRILQERRPKRDLFHSRARSEQNLLDSADYSIGAGSRNKRAFSSAVDRRKLACSQVGEKPKAHHNERRLDYKSLKEILLMSSSEIVMKLAAPGSGLSEFLNQENIKYDLVELILEILDKAIGCKTSRQNLQHLLSHVQDSTFLKQVLPFYIMELNKRMTPDMKLKIETPISCILTVLLELISVFPSSCAMQVSLVEALLVPAISDLQITLSEKVENKLSTFHTCLKHLQEKKREGTLRSNNYTYIMGKDQDSNLEDFRQIPIFPAYDDIHLKENPIMRPNIINSKYLDANMYLDTHFRLLREDFIRPLRDGIAQILWFQGKELTKAKFDDIRIYSGTRICSLICARTGILNQVEFEVGNLKAVLWESSKRLLFGSLVCLSKDNFKTMLFATVADRNVQDLKKGIVTLKFTNDSRQKLVEMEVNDTFLMVETTAYFEAYRHVLEGLKELAGSDIPLQNYIVHCETDVSPPQYLIKNRHGYSLKMLMRDGTLPMGSVFDIESSDSSDDDDDYSDCFGVRDSKTENLRKRLAKLLMNEYPTKPTSQPTQEETMPSADFDVLDFNTWPSKEQLNLDKSQISALQSALTKELSIIQGPPGTGKTYVGLKIVKTLLANSHIWQSSGHNPILVVCYTNHALDQFLEGIYTFLKDGIVRIGSRSNSEIIQEFSLSTFRNSRGFMNSFPGHLRALHAELSDERKKIEDQIQEKASCLENTSKGIITEVFLTMHMPEHHFRSLMSVQMTEQFCRPGKKPSVIAEWLGVSMLMKKSVNMDIVQESNRSTAHGEDQRSELMQLINMIEENENAKDKLSLMEENPDEETIHVVEEAEHIQAERMMEDDDVRKQIMQAKHRAALKGREMLAVPLKEEEEEEDVSVAGDDDGGEGLWEMTRDMKRKLKKLVKRELKKKDHMDEEEAEKISDLWMLPYQKRWELYRLWRFNYITNIRRKLNTIETHYQHVVEKMDELRNQEDMLIMKKARVVGMTTTGAAKYRKVLQDIGPKIIIVEEAAEVLEAHIITTLSAECEHLILIGDHQQLRPSSTVYELAKNFNLEVSMFERLVRMDVQYVRLDYQHRMRPEIARLLTPHIYDELENHSSVYEYEKIKGVDTNLFFVQHDHLEEHIKEGKSHRNMHEAAFIKGLCRYFICQDYKPSQITVLTTYSGQLQCLRKLMPKAEFEGVRVCVVDKYQGEENDIILLSLVRSNPEGNAGFLRIPNRICVALSRAKKGLFCIGNMQMLSGVLLWSKIMDVLTEQGHLGKELLVRCENHPNHVCSVSKAEDFSKVPEGGCMEPCEYRMTCGHACALVCHPYDPQHKEITCKKPCIKDLCENGHRCKKLCFEDCGSCLKLVQKKIPKCGHIQEVPCSVLPEVFSCMEPCPKLLSCGHKCVRPCGRRCTLDCPEKITKQLACGHSIKIMCYLKREENIQCSVTCPAKLACGHSCVGTCSKCSEGRQHVACTAQCDFFTICSHRCEGVCSEDCLHCLYDCENNCFHGKCPNKCSELCLPCTKPCGWKCKHAECTKHCCEPCNRDPCSFPCTRKLGCGHPCIGLCGEPCPQKCRVCHAEEVNELFFGKEADPESRFILLRDCKHIFEVTEFTKWMNHDDGDGVIKLKCCPKCLMPIRHHLRYNDMIKRTLADIEVVKKEIAKIWTKQLEEFLNENKSYLRYFPCATESMEHLINLGITIRSIVLISEKVNYFFKLGKIKTKVEQLSLSDQHWANQNIQVLYELIEKAQSKFNIMEQQNKLFRLALFVESCCLKKTSVGILKVRYKPISSTLIVKNKLMSSTFLTDKDLKEKHDEIKTLSPVPLELATLVQDKKSILDTRLLRQGQWYRCSEGHIFNTVKHHSPTAACPQCSSSEDDLGKRQEGKIIIMGT